VPAVNIANSAESSATQQRIAALNSLKNEACRVVP
jgi:hypothetical protein